MNGLSDILASTKLVERLTGSGWGCVCSKGEGRGGSADMQCIGVRSVATICCASVLNIWRCMHALNPAPGNAMHMRKRGAMHTRRRCAMHTRRLYAMHTRRLYAMHTRKLYAMHTRSTNTTSMMLATRAKNATKTEGTTVLTVMDCTSMTVSKSEELIVWACYAVSIASSVAIDVISNCFPHIKQQNICYSCSTLGISNLLSVGTALPIREPNKQTKQKRSQSNTQTNTQTKQQTITHGQTDKLTHEQITNKQTNYQTNHRASQGANKGKENKCAKKQTNN